MSSDLSAQVVTHLNDGIPNIQGDRNQLRQVVHNLLQNAQDALTGCDDPRIDVETAERAGVVELVVSDNGSGIPEAILKRVFEPYVTTKAKGTGLGLAIVKKIIDEHRGTVSITPNSPRGTKIQMRFPALKAA